eukprot:2824980-Amphidinium_carterae.1
MVWNEFKTNSQAPKLPMNWFHLISDSSRNPTNKSGNHGFQQSISTSTMVKERSNKRSSQQLPTYWDGE